MRTGSAPGRRLIGGALVGTAGWIVAATLLGPRSFWVDTAQFIPLLLAVTVLLMSLRRLGSSHAESRFVVREGVGFVVPPNLAFARFVVGGVLLFGFLVVQTIGRWQDPDPGTRLIAVIETVMDVAFGAIVAASTVGVLRGRPRVELTRAALVVRDGLSRRTIPWEALRPGLPEAGWDTLILAFDRPELVARSGLAWSARRIVLGFLRVRPQFLADAIRTYVAHPKRRAAIGTPAEYELLLGQETSAASG